MPASTHLVLLILQFRTGAFVSLSLTEMTDSHVQAFPAEGHPTQLANAASKAGYPPRHKGCAADAAFERNGHAFNLVRFAPTFT